MFSSHTGLSVPSCVFGGLGLGDDEARRIIDRATAREEVTFLENLFECLEIDALCIHDIIGGSA